jgi:hypothetical protein
MPIHYGYIGTYANPSDELITTSVAWPREEVGRKEHEPENRVSRGEG